MISTQQVAPVRNLYSLPRWGNDHGKTTYTRKGPSIKYHTTHGRPRRSIRSSRNFVQPFRANDRGVNIPDIKKKSAIK